MEIGVTRIDALYPVLPHQNGNLGIIEKVAVQIRRFPDDSRRIFRSLIETSGEGAISHDQEGENRRRFRTSLFLTSPLSKVYN